MSRIAACALPPPRAPAARLAAGLAGDGWVARTAFLYHREEMGPTDHPISVLTPRPPRGPVDHLRIVRALARLIRAERPDAIVGFLPLASVSGAVIARFLGVPARIVSHRVPRETYGPTMRLLDTIAAWTGCYTDVIAVSASVGGSCRSYPRWLKRRIAVVYNGLKGWTPSPHGRAAARAKLGLPADAFVLAAVGRLDVQKNYPLLIAAMALVAGDVVLAIAGSGPLEEAIATDVAERGLARRIRLLGALSRGDVPDLLAAADAFVQPSLFEGQSNALLEALHAGLPCLVSDVPEQVETVRADDGAVAGAILPLDAPEAWACAIDGLAADPARVAAAHATAKRMAGRFTFARMMEGFEAVLEKAIARGRRT